MGIPEIVPDSIMKIKILYAALFFSALSVAFYSIVSANSTGATYGVCGAPDDQVPGTSCGYAGCHSIAPITDSNALKITLIDQLTSLPVTTYQLGKKYTVKIELNYRSLIACGFESEIEIPKSPYTHMGKMTAGTRSQILNGPKSAQYATHTSSARAGLHYGMWQYTWTAPTTNTGDLIIYAAGNSANGNGFQDGDTIFTTQMTISHNAGIENQILNSDQISVFPVPANDHISINYSLAKEENTTVELYNIQGQQVRSIQSGLMPTGSNKVQADITGLPIGIYFLRITAGGEMAVKKIMVGE